MKNSIGLADRYHHMYRLKKFRAKYHYFYDYSPCGRQLGIYYHSPAICSCPMCGNPRKHFGERTIQELKYLEQMDYDLLELNK